RSSALVEPADSSVSSAPETAEALGRDSTSELLVLGLFIVVVLIGGDAADLPGVPFVPLPHELLDGRVELGGRHPWRGVTEVVLHPDLQPLDRVGVGAHALDLRDDLG